MLRFLSLISVIFVVSVLRAGPVAAQDSDVAAIAAFLGVPDAAVSVECPQHSYTLSGTGDDRTLKVCLNQADKQRRCEIAVHALKMAPDIHNHIQFQFRTEGDYAALDQWFALMQIHSMPDKGEAWRCPVTAVEMERGSLRMFNRWDASPLSRTSGNNCTEPGSSIQGRTLFTDAPASPRTWHAVDIDAVLSAITPGHIKVALDGTAKADVTGPNAYNDRSGPYLKFGIYKPTSWEPGNDGLCIAYKNVKIDAVQQ